MCVAVGGGVVYVIPHCGPQGCWPSRSPLPWFPRALQADGEQLQLWLVAPRGQSWKMVLSSIHMQRARSQRFLCGVYKTACPALRPGSSPNTSSQLVTT